ncbi:MAG: hypothetical protein IT480_02535 [Gammaproteobacteria bacterium]|nr:hypothetical protein [Gammaproteobacteria bacterium]
MPTRKLLACVLSAATVAFGGAAAQGSEDGVDHSRWGTYVITEMPAPSAADQAGQDAEAVTLGERVENMTRGVRELNDKVVKGSYYTDVAWIMKANPGRVWVKEHSHPFDEVLGFFGSDPEHPDELNAVIEISIDGEKHVLTKSALVFVPKNIKHCPLTIQKVDRPVLFFTTGPTASYDIDR